MGRQSYLVALPLLGLPLLANGNWRDRIISSAIASAFFLMITGPVFWLWKGYAPPGLEREVQGLSLQNGVLGAMYLGLFIFLVCPQWIFKQVRMRSSLLLPLILTCGILGVVTASKTSHMPMRGIMQKLPGPFEHAITGALIAIGLLLAFLVFQGMLRSAIEPETTAFEKVCIAITLGGCISCIAMKAQFSPRYLLASFPFALYPLQPSMRLDSPLSMTFGIVGAGVGITWLAQEYGWL
jgi:hypothetical protein